MSAGLAALRAATSKERGPRASDDIRERLARVVDRSPDRDDTPKSERRNYARDRLKEIMERDGQAAVHKLDGYSEHDLGEGRDKPGRTPSHHQRQDRADDTARAERKPSMKARLEEVLNKPREPLDRAEGRVQERDGDENENTRDRDRGEGHSL